MNTDTKTVDLMLSYGGLLHKLYREGFPAKILFAKTTIFYFGCNRSHVFDHAAGSPNGELQTEFQRDPAGVHAVTQLVRFAAATAEADHRAAWRAPREFTSLDQFNSLLRLNGLPAIPGLPPYTSFCPTSVGKALAKLDLPYRVHDH